MTSAPRACLFPESVQYSFHLSQTTELTVPAVLSSGALALFYLFGCKTKGNSILQYQRLFISTQSMQAARPRSGSANGSSAATSANSTSASLGQAPLTAETAGYAIRPIPINDIEAFRKHTPSIGTHHVAIVMRDGSVCPTPPLLKPLSHDAQLLLCFCEGTAVHVV